MEKEILHSVPLETNKYFHFIEPEKRQRSEQQKKYDLKFLILEIKSKLPPTDFVFKLAYTSWDDTTIKYLDIDMIKYRKDFKYENNLYILYLDEIAELPKSIRPHTFSIQNKREPDSTATLFYSTKIH